MSRHRRQCWPHVGLTSPSLRALMAPVAPGLIALTAPQLLTAPAVAQIQPGLTNPGLQQQQELQQQRQRPPEIPREPLAPVVPPAEDEEPAPGQEDPDLVIRQVEVQGARVLSAERIRAVFEPLLSTAEQPRSVRFSQLQEALAAASNLYRAEGYFTSRVVLPRGGLENGVLRVLAVEGFIENVEVTGRGSAALRRWARFYLSPLVSTAAEPRPIRFRQLERQLLLMQGFGGVRFSSTLAKGSSFAGSTLVLELNPIALSGSVGVDNNVQPQLGDIQVVAQAQGNLLNTVQPIQINAWGSYAFPYAGGLGSASFSLNTPIGNRGLRLVGLGSYTSTNSTTTPLSVGGPDLDFRTAGESWLGSLALRYPLLLSRSGSLSVSLAAEAQNSTNNAYLDDLLAFSNPTRLRVLRLGVSGNQVTPYHASNASLQISQGLPIASAYDAATLAQSGGSLSSGSVSYTSARLSLSHQQRIGNGETFITISGSGQLSSTLLPTPEDFSYGGPYLGRAYRSSYLIGDQGVGASLEISHAFYRGNWTLTPFLFGDVGMASNNGTVPTPDNYQASSYGIGLRGSWRQNTSWEVGWGIPAGPYPAATERAGPTHSIVYFRANLSF